MPSNTWSLLLALALLLIGINSEMNMMFSNVVDETPVILYITNNLMSVILSVYLILPMFVVSAWMEKFITICESKSVVNRQAHTKRCLKMFNSMKNAFGSFFFYVFREAMKILIILTVDIFKNPNIKWQLNLFLFMPH